MPTSAARVVRLQSAYFAGPILVAPLRCGECHAQHCDESGHPLAFRCARRTWLGIDVVASLRSTLNMTQSMERAVSVANDVLVPSAQRSGSKVVRLSASLGKRAVDRFVLLASSLFLDCMRSVSGGEKEVMKPCVGCTVCSRQGYSEGLVIDGGAYAGLRVQRLQPQADAVRPHRVRLARCAVQPTMAAPHAHSFVPFSLPLPARVRPGLQSGRHRPVPTGG